MCGILGIAGVQRVDQTRFRDALAKLTHRGPDATDTKSWPKNVTFGFVRLAIQDLTDAGQQPMSHAGAGVTIVFNGEIYNFKILRQELIREGSTFNTRTDTEVILNAYVQWGWDKTLDKLEGMFAIAIYDERRQKIILARDKFGQKPLFFKDDPNKGFIFSSEIKSIIHLTDGTSIDLLSSLNPIFTTGLSPRGKTCFKDIQQVQEGEYVVYDVKSRNHNSVKYFSAADLIDPQLYNEIKNLSKTDLLDLYLKTFEESVKLHLISDAPLASLFSAGLDSTLITNLAAKSTQIDLYHFESESDDYQHYANNFADKLGLKLNISKGNDVKFIESLPRMTYHYETVNKEEGPVLAQLCQMASNDGFKVMLTGDASDEIFGGQPHHATFRNKLRYFDSPLAHRLLQIFGSRFPGSPLGSVDEDPRGTDYNSFPPLNHMNEVPMNCLYHKGERLDDWNRCLAAYDFIEDKTEQATMAYMLDEVDYRLQRFMIRADRLGMMESMELRLPFLYTPIVKLCVNTPSYLRMYSKKFWRGTELKGLLKELGVHSGIDRDLVYRKKIGTPFNNTPQIIKVLEKLNLTNLSDLLEVPADKLRDIALGSFDKNISRVQYSFLSMEILVRLFIHNENHENISEEFKAII
jgi:asparagine synthase (glutamine-hydrolysing)